MKFQTFEANVSDGTGTVDGKPLVCRSFTQSKKFLLDWMLTRKFNSANGAAEIVAKPGVTCTVTPRQVDFDYPSEAEAKGFRPARDIDSEMPERTFKPVKNDKGEWCLAEAEADELTPEEIAECAAAEVKALAEKLAAAKETAKEAKRRAREAAEAQESAAEESETSDEK